ncbi:MAG: S-methyl-5-thioribose-1-phosphate isomerase [Chloroflexota bacterium]|jgi:methylthioribose-1-phosphate isomerase
MTKIATMQWQDEGVLVLLDQRVLPHQVRFVRCKTAGQTAEAIANMTVRGAPAIGAAAAYGLALTAWHHPSRQPDELHAALKESARVLENARPTAVNLKWAIQRVLSRVEPAIQDAAIVREAILAEAHAIAGEDVQTNKAIGMHALGILPLREITFIHHCNTGSLATVEYGTALGIIRTAHENGRKVMVYVDETRPRLQGARLTAWELDQLGIPYKIIADGASGHVMKNFRVDAVVVGCDRVAANGDTANKIGTYNLALAAAAHNVPFYVACPTSTIDLNAPDSSAIPIEERSAEEITHIEGKQICPQDAQVYNPAFDVTPAKWITAIITENGVCRPPYEQSLQKAALAGRHSY